MIKLAILRSDNKPCPFGLSIPNGFKSAGNLFNSMHLIENGSNKFKNISLVENYSEKKPCIHNRKIINDFVNCEAPFDTHTKEFPREPVKFYTPMGGLGLEGLTTDPIGYLYDNSLDNGYYYGNYSMESVAELRLNFKNAIAYLSKNQYSRK